MGHEGGGFLGGDAGGYQGNGLLRRVNWAEKHRRKTAVLVSGDLHFGLSRMFEQFIGPAAHGKIKTFRELPLATEWIDARATVSPHQAEG